MAAKEDHERICAWLSGEKGNDELVRRVLDVAEWSQRYPVVDQDGCLTGDVYDATDPRDDVVIADVDEDGDLEAGDQYAFVLPDGWVSDDAGQCDAYWTVLREGTEAERITAFAEELGLNVMENGGGGLTIFADCHGDDPSAPGVFLDVDKRTGQITAVGGHASEHHATWTAAHGWGHLDCAESSISSYATEYA